MKLSVKSKKLKGALGNLKRGEAVKFSWRIGSELIWKNRALQSSAESPFQISSKLNVRPVNTAVDFSPTMFIELYR